MGLHQLCILLILSTIFLLTLPISDFVGLIRRHLVLLVKFSLYSFMVMNAVFLRNLQGFQEILHAENVKEFTYLGDRVSAGGGCEATVTVRTRCWWVKFREYGELLYGRRFPLRLKGAVYKSYVRPAILYGSEAWCLKESEMGILQRTEISMVRAMCGVQLKDRKKCTDLMFMLGLDETIDQLAMANSVCWYGHVLRKEDGHVLRRSFHFVFEGQRMKGRLKKTW